MANTTGAGGRPRRPAHLRELEGNPGHRPIPTEPTPTPAAAAPAALPPDKLPPGLEPPDYLDEIGRQLWAELAPELSRLKLLTVLDRPLLAAACERWSLYRRAAGRVKRTISMRTKANGLTQRPEVVISNNALAITRQLLAELGVTAAARARLGIIDAEKVSDPDEDFINSRPEGISA